MKTTRRILAVMLTVMLVLALSAVTVLAEGNTLTVTGSELSGKNVTIVPMFKAVATDEKYHLVNAWKTFFAGKTGVEATSDEISSKAYQYMLTMTDNSTEMDAFAKDARDYYNAHTTDFASIAVTKEAVDNTATFTELEAGSYLIMPESGSTSTTRHTDAMIKNVIDGETNAVTIKSIYPTVDKTVAPQSSTTFADDTTAKIGDTVSFKLTSTVPDMTDYESNDPAVPAYKFSFVDTMSEGLTYVADSVEVTIGTKDNAALVAANDYTVTAPDYTATPVTNVLTIAFADLKKVTGIVAGDTITVTYSAKINEKAVVGGNTNSAEVVYSNNPSDTTETNHSTPDISTVYTYSIVIDKYTMDNTTKVQLPGAVFEISTTSGGTAIQLVSEGNDVYHVATTEEIDDTDVAKVSQVTSPASGLITIEGLNTGTYYIKEVTPPTGYNGLQDPVSVEIIKGTTFAETTYKVGDATAASDNTVGILNRPGALIPTTGGIGTIIFTVLGAGVIIAGVVFTSRKKKEDK